MDTNTENKEQGRASYTDEERRELIEEFKAADMTQAAFCREWNINPKTLGRWLRSEREGQAVEFCEVEIPAASMTERSVRVCFPNQIEMIVSIDSTAGLNDLFRAAAQC